MNKFTISLKNGQDVDLDMSIFEIDEKKGLVNLTKIAKACGKQVRTWSETDQTKEYLQACKNSFVDFEGLTTVKGGHSSEQGTWATREVALDFAMWISPSFKVWCIKVLDELFQKGSVSLKQMSHADALRAYADSLDALEIQTKETEKAKQLADKKAKSARKAYGGKGGITKDRNRKVKLLDETTKALEDKQLSYEELLDLHRRTVRFYENESKFGL